MRGYRFSLRMLLAIVAFAAANLGLWVSKPTWQSGLLALLFFFVTPALSLVVIANVGGYLRTFFIGFFVPSLCIAIAYVVFIFEHWLDFKTHRHIEAVLGYASVCLLPSVAVLSFAPAVGLFCVATHWLFIRPAGSGELKE